MKKCLALQFNQVEVVKKFNGGKTTTMSCGYIDNSDIEIALKIYRQITLLFEYKGTFTCSRLHGNNFNSKHHQMAKATHFDFEKLSCDLVPQVVDEDL